MFNIVQVIDSNPKCLSNCILVSYRDQTSLLVFVIETYIQTDRQTDSLTKRVSE